jgi:hypothetical protein
MANKSTKLIRSKAGILLDVSFGGKPQVNSVTLAPAGNLRHDPRRVPFPLPARSVHTAVVTHVLEFVPGDRWFAWWDELHRVMRPGGVCYVSGPYGGDESQGWLSDPTHLTRVVEQSFAWLDPRTPFYGLHESLGRPAPAPWWPLAIARVPGAHGTVSYNVTLQTQAAAK